MTAEARAAPTTDGAAGTPVVTVQGVSHSFQDRSGTSIAVLDDVSFDVAPGAFVAIVGPSGCGKTTLLHLVAGLEELQTGRLVVLGESPAAGRPAVSILFARDVLLPWRSALDNVALPLEVRGVGRAERRERAAAMLGLVGLGGLEASLRAELSQGQRQRVALARALVTHPRLLVLDEPFAALDAQTRLTIQEELHRMIATQQPAATVVMVTHDIDEAVALSDRVIELSARPARPRQTYEVGLGWPRDLTSLRRDPVYVSLCDRIRSSVAGGVDRPGP